MSRCCYKISLNHSGMCVLSLACNELCTVALSTYIAIFPRLLYRPLHYYIRSSSVAAFTVWALTFNHRFRLVTAVRTYILSHWTHWSVTTPTHYTLLRELLWQCCALIYPARAVIHTKIPLNDSSGYCVLWHWPRMLLSHCGHTSLLFKGRFLGVYVTTYAVILYVYWVCSTVFPW